MSRSRVTILLLSAPLALILFAGCAHHASPAIAPAAPATSVAAVPPAVPGTPAQPTNFQPYTLLPTPAPRAPSRDAQAPGPARDSRP